MTPLSTHRNFIIPVVGEGVTIGIGSDRYPATIIEVSKNLKKIVVQYDIATPAPDCDIYSNQNWVITSDPNGRTRTYTWRKRGVWVELRQAHAVGYLSLKGRSKYINPSF